MEKDLFPDVERFSELAFNIFKINTDTQKDDFKQRYEQARRNNIAISNKIEETISYAKTKEWNSLIAIWNVAGFITLISLDLKTIIEEMIFGIENEWKINYLIRSLCVLLYESIDDISDIMGQRLYKNIIKYNLDKEILEQLYEKKKAILYFKNKYSKDLRVIRNYAGAHRDHDFMEQISVIKKLDISVFLQLANDFEKRLNELGTVYQAVVNSTANLFVKNNGIYDKKVE